MWLLDRFFKTPQKPVLAKGMENSISLPLPPYDLLDRHFQLPDEVEVKVVGFQYGGKLLHIPFLVRCRVIQTAELVLIDPKYIRRVGHDITPLDAKKEALRKPFVPREEEVARLIGWKSRTKTGKNSLPDTELNRIADQDRGEGGVQ